MLPFQPDLAPNEPVDPPITNGQDIPKELDIFFRSESAFLPEGKTFETLTKEEREELRSRYRFDPFRPGLYQGITGMGDMI